MKEMVFLLLSSFLPEGLVKAIGIVFLDPVMVLCIAIVTICFFVIFKVLFSGKEKGKGVAKNKNPQMAPEVIKEDVFEKLERSGVFDFIAEMIDGKIKVASTKERVLTQMEEVFLEKSPKEDTGPQEKTAADSSSSSDSSDSGEMTVEEARNITKDLIGKVVGKEFKGENILLAKGDKVTEEIAEKVAQIGGIAVINLVQAVMS